MRAQTLIVKIYLNQKLFFIIAIVVVPRRQKSGNMGRSYEKPSEVSVEIVLLKV